MALWRWFQASTGMRSLSKKILTKDAGRKMVLREQRGYMIVSMEKKAPRRSVSGSISSAAYMARSVGMWTVAPIWRNISGSQFAQATVLQAMYPFE